MAATKYFALTKKNPNIEAAGSVLVAIANRTGWDMKEWEEIQLETALRDKASLEMVNIMNNAPNQVNECVKEMAMGNGVDNYRGIINEVIFNQSMTPAAAMSSIRGTVQAYINEMVNS